MPVECFCSLPFVGDGKYMGWYIWGISTDSVSVMVPGGCCSWGCSGYLHALLEAHISAPPSLRHLSQAHLFAMTLNEHA